MKVLGLGMAALGVIAIILGIIWMTVLFPKFEKIPEDFVRIDDIVGSYTVVDPIVNQIQANATIQQVRSSAPTLQMLADPTIQQLMTSPAFGQLMANPAQLQQLLANPAALQQADPAVRQVLSNPTVQRLLADPVVQALLKDAAALKLLADPRTMELLKDPTVLPTVKVPVKIHRERRATGAEGDKLMLTEEVTTLRADTNQELTGYPKTTTKLVIDRRTTEYLEGTEGGRTGSLGLPFNVDSSKTYDIWVGAARAALEAKYVGDETLDGLKVMVFRVDVKDRPMGTHPDLKLPMVVDSQITIRAEPRSGRIVDSQDHTTTVSVVHPQHGKLPVFVSDIELSDESVAQQVAAGKSDKSKLNWLGTYTPWIIIIVGAVLAVGGPTVFAWARRKPLEAAKEEAAADRPPPTHGSGT